MASYDPDGVHEESPTYWEYGTGFFVLMAMGLETAVGKSWGIADHPGFRKSFAYRLHADGPGLRAFNYGDGGEGGSPLLFHPWMARRADRPDWAAAFRDRDPLVIRHDRSRLFPLPLLHWPEAPAEKPSRPPLDFIGHGAVELASMRSAWGDPDARWIALRGGRVDVNHGHMDVGSFVLEADGVRWAVDLGSERAIYARKDAWGTGDGSLRWTFLRAGIGSHNTLVLDGGMQKTDGHCPIKLVGPGVAEIDLTSAWPQAAERIVRRVSLEENRSWFRITDTVHGPSLTKELRWQMATRADVDISDDGNRATLTQKGRKLNIRCAAPLEGAGFSVGALTPSRPEEYPNEGVRMLVLTWPAPLPDPAVVNIEIVPE